VGLRQVFLQEIIRAIALGYVVFALIGLGRNNLGLSGHQVMTVARSVDRNPPKNSKIRRPVAKCGECASCVAPILRR
jgi:hypothetical protein